MSSSLPFGVGRQKETEREVMIDANHGVVITIVARGRFDMKRTLMPPNGFAKFMFPMFPLGSHKLWQQQFRQFSVKLMPAQMKRDEAASTEHSRCKGVNIWNRWRKACSCHPRFNKYSLTLQGWHFAVAGVGSGHFVFRQRHNFPVDTLYTTVVLRFPVNTFWGLLIS